MNVVLPPVATGATPSTTPSTRIGTPILGVNARPTLAGPSARVVKAAALAQIAIDDSSSATPWLPAAANGMASRPIAPHAQARDRSGRRARAALGPAGGAPSCIESGFANPALLLPYRSTTTFRSDKAAVVPASNRLRTWRWRAWERVRARPRGRRPPRIDTGDAHDAPESVIGCGRRRWWRAGQRPRGPKGRVRFPNPGKHSACGHGFAACTACSLASPLLRCGSRGRARGDRSTDRSRRIRSQARRRSVQVCCRCWRFRKSPACAVTAPSMRICRS